MFIIWAVGMDSEGKDAGMVALRSGSIPSSNSGSRSLYSDCVPLSHITSNPSLGAEKVFISKYCFFQSNNASRYNSNFSFSSIANC